MKTNMLLWSPNEPSLDTSNLRQFIQHINMQGEAIESMDQLHEWSIQNSKSFWMDIWQFCDVIGYQGDCIIGEGINKWAPYLEARDTFWFPQAQLNYAENLLSYAFQDPEATAIWFNNEEGAKKSLTWQQVSDQVSIVQQWLKQNGVEKGDIIVGYLPSIPETVIALLAATSLGAIWSSLNPQDTDSEEVLKHFQQLQPKVLFCSNGYHDTGKLVNLEVVNKYLAQSLNSLSCACQIEYIPSHNLFSEIGEKGSEWQAIMSSYLPRGLKYERVNFNAPLFIFHHHDRDIKTIHSVGGTILNHLKEHQLHCNFLPKTRLFSLSPTSSSCWFWEISAMATGTTLVLFEGNPTFPAADGLWALLDESETNVFYLDENYLDKIESTNLSYVLNHLNSVIIRAHRPIDQLYKTIYTNLKSEIPIIIVSCEEAILGSFFIGNTISEVHVNDELPKALGYDIEQISATEMYCRNSFPNQPIGLWQDNGEKYHKLYWENTHRAWQIR